MMTSLLWLALFIGIQGQVMPHRPRGPPGPRGPGFPFGPCRGESHFCTTYFKVSVDREYFPSCPSNDSCSGCGVRSWWWGRRACPSCCSDRALAKELVQEQRRVCCPGYFGLNCDQAFCSQPCEEPNTDCTAPNTCGPVCFPPCLNGGSCVGGNPDNKCVCSEGWTGLRCEKRELCNATDANSCQNGGTCFHGLCLCDGKFAGVFCEKEICMPPCENGGLCSNGTCTCVEGYSGASCEIPPANYLP